MIQNKNNTNSRIFNLVAAIPWFPLPPFSSPSVRNPPCILLSLHVRPNSAICTVFSRLVAQNGGRASILQSRNSRLFSYGLCPSLADHEARDARTSIDCHRNYQRAVALFPYSRVSTTVSRVASQFCRKKQYATTPSPSFPRLSNYLFSHRHLSPSIHTRPHFVSPLPSLSSSPTHIRTHVQTAILHCFHSFTPLYSPLPFLYFSLSPSLFAIRSPASTSLSRPFPFVLEKERNRDAIRNPFDGTKKYEC